MLKGTEAMVKRAEMEKELAALANEGESMTTEETHDTNSDDDLMNLIQSADADLEAVNSIFSRMIPNLLEMQMPMKPC